MNDVHDQYRLENKPDYYVMHGYDEKEKKWKFSGYVCNVCGQTLRTAYVANKHVCGVGKVRVKKSDDYLNEATIYTVEGQRWKPIDFNQNHT